MALTLPLNLQIPRSRWQLYEHATSLLGHLKGTRDDSFWPDSKAARARRQVRFWGQPAALTTPIKRSDRPGAAVDGRNVAVVNVFAEETLGPYA
jgi:hypothetical protein